MGEITYSQHLQRLAIERCHSGVEIACHLPQKINKPWLKPDGSEDAIRSAIGPLKQSRHTRAKRLSDSHEASATDNYDSLRSR